MGSIIATLAGKGGVAKTTSTSILAMSLIGKGYKVLAVENEPQGNLTTLLLDTFGYDEEDLYSLNANLYNAIYDNDLESNIITLDDNLHLLSGDETLTKLEAEAIQQYGSRPENYTMILKDALADIKEEYDYILIDTPPDKNFYTSIALSCADYALVVSEVKKHSVDGVIEFCGFIYDMQVLNNPNLKIIGVLPVGFETNKKTKRQEMAMENLLLVNEIVSDIDGFKAVFTNGLRRLERIDRYNNDGFKFIADPKDLSTAVATRETESKILVEHHDKVAYAVFEGFVSEFLERIEKDRKAK